MLINFLDSNLSPTIQCSAISSEGYEISNLVSSNRELLQKGFLGEGFVAGPVTITIKFICAVSVKSVIIWSQVGGQRSVGIELSSVDSEKVMRLASGFIPEDISGIVFCKEGCRFGNDEYPAEVNSFPLRTFSRNKGYENVNTMQIKIFKYRYVPAIKKIEIWGEPNRRCDAKLKNNVRSMWLQSRKYLDIEKSYSNPECDDTFDSSSHLNEEEVPEEFFDQITQELMTLPMILPSGKIVDHSTIEKFRIEEAKWGRLPSDPFTGLSFTESRKPVVAVTLKSKIDSFCLSNPNVDQIKTVPRRLGGEKETFSCANLKISRIVDQNNPNKRKLCPLENEGSLAASKIFVKQKGVKNLPNNSVSESVSNVLDKMLSHLPSYLNEPKTEKKNFAVICYDCSSPSDLYKLLCDHIICKICLIRNRNCCRSCNLTFSSAQVQKIHVTESRPVL